MGLAPVIFCLVLIAMGAMTLLTELLSLISAAFDLIVGALLLGLWASTCLFSQRTLKVAFGFTTALGVINAVFGLVAWIVLIVERANVPSGVILGREAVIATGFACWAFVLCTQIAFIVVLGIHASRAGKFSSSGDIRISTQRSTALSPSNSVIPMRRATIHHHPSIASLAPSRLSHRLTQSWTSPPTSPTFLPPPPPARQPVMPIATNLTTPTLKQQTSLPNFPLALSSPITSPRLRSTDSISSLQITNTHYHHPPPTENPLSAFPFRNSLITQSSSPLPAPIDPPPLAPTKRTKRTSGSFLKSLTLTGRPESPILRQKPSLSSLPTPTFSTRSSRKRFKTRDEHLSVSSVSESTVWDDWAPGDEDHVRVRQRVEMSFESVRLEKAGPPPVASAQGIARASPSCAVLAGRNVSAGSSVASPVETPGGEIGHWANSPASVLMGLGKRS